jgi:hypothetical protein
MGSADGRCARLGEAEVENFALLDEIADRPGHLLDRYLRIDAVLIEQIDAVGAKALQRAFDGDADVRRAAVHRADAANGVRDKPELARDTHLVAEWGERLAHKLFVRIWAVDLGCIEEGDAVLMGFTKDSDALRLICGRSVVGADAHGAGAELRDFELSEFACLHRSFTSRDS